MSLSVGLENKLVVGVDVGGSKVAVLVADEHDQVHARLSAPTCLDSPQATLDGILDTIRRALDASQATQNDVAAAGFGFPGRVDPEQGSVQLAVNLNWQDMPAGPLLSRALGVPCFLENDVRMATFGVMHHPQFAEVKNLAYLSVGTGIAAGLFLNGELYRGAHGMAGEIGHVVIDPAGPRCQCGGRGCLEALAAGPAIARRALEYVSQGVSTSLRQVNPLTADAVYREALKGDPAALEITREAGKYQARALQHLVMTYDVEVVVIGGGVARAGNAFFRPILDEIEQQRQVSALAFEMLQPTIFRLLPGRYEAALWGGVVLARLGIQRLQSNLPGMRIGKQDPKREEADSENISNQPSLHRINKPY